MNRLPVRLRNPVEEDFNFIINSWLKSYRNSPFATHISNDIYFHTHGNIIKNLLENSRIVVICNQEDVNQILGYVVYEIRENLFIIHFVYLKYTYRKLGLMKESLTQIFELNQHIDKPTFITHLPRNFDELKLKHKYAYNPYLLEIK